MCLSSSHFDVPPRGCVPDRKCVLMWMDVFQETGWKGPPKTVRTPENVERVRVSIQTDYVTMIQQFFLPAIQEKDLDNVWLQQDGATAPIGVWREELALNH
ncbi:hypothetical protein TNCV_2696111 [Trichonephila clavipes]|nr:hypothetical protein TNCV_2696111 [Trichonephila clavipes]